MKPQPTKEDLLKSNPRVDAAVLDKSLELAEQLRDAGMTRARYTLATPASGRRSMRLPGTPSEAHAHRRSR